MEKKSIQTPSDTEVEFIDVDYTWEIINYNFYFSDKTAKLYSKDFAPADKSDIKWQLELTPAVTLDHRSYTGLWVTLIDSSSYIVEKAHVKLFTSQVNDTKISIHNALVSINEGQNRFGSDYYDCKYFPMINNKLTIICEIKMKIKTKDRNPSCFKLNSKDLLQDYEKIMQNEKFSDFKLIASDGKEFKVHRVVLSVRSPVFAALFEHDTKENKEKLARINDVNNEAMEELLRYIYTGKVEKLDTLAYELLSASDKYALDELKQLCESVLVKNITIDNVMSVLALADLHKAENIKERALEFMASNLSSIVDTPGFNSLRKMHWSLVEEMFKKLAVK